MSWKNKMIGKLVIVLTLAMSVLPSKAYGGDSSKNVPAKFALAGMNGGSFSQSDLKSDVYIVQFWASWCSSCGGTMKQIGKWSVAKKGAKYVQVSVDENMSEARQYFKGKNSSLEGFRKTVYLDPEGKFAAKVGVTSIPTVMVIGKDGRILKTVVGHPSQADLKSFDQLISSQERSRS